MSCFPRQVWCFTCHMSSVRCHMAYFLVFRCASISSSDDCHSLTDWLTHSLADWKWSYTTSVLIIDIEIVTEFTKYTVRSLRGKCYQNWNVTKGRVPKNFKILSFFERGTVVVFFWEPFPKTEMSLKLKSQQNGHVIKTEMSLKLKIL